jgi:ArsR family transcriptional regulator
MIPKNKKDRFTNQFKSMISAVNIDISPPKERVTEIDYFKDTILTNSFIEKEEKILETLKALSNKNRLEIIFLLKQGVRCLCELEYILDVSQPTISHHLKILESASIIIIERNGKWNLISLNESPLIYWFLDQLKD